MIEFTLLLKWYLIGALAFSLSSVLTLVLPAWAIAKEWARVNLKDIPSNGHVFAHIIIYIIVAFILFPLLLVAVLKDNEAAVAGYATSIIQAIQKK